MITEPPRRSRSAAPARKVPRELTFREALRLNATTSGPNTAAGTARTRGQDGHSIDPASTRAAPRPTTVTTLIAHQPTLPAQPTGAADAGWRARPPFAAPRVQSCRSPHREPRRHECAAGDRPRYACSSPPRALRHQQRVVRGPRPPMCIACRAMDTGTVMRRLRQQRRAGRSAAGIYLLHGVPVAYGGSVTMAGGPRSRS